jgi:hypothetical protein
MDIASTRETDGCGSGPRFSVQLSIDVHVQNLSPGKPHPAAAVGTAERRRCPTPAADLEQATTAVLARHRDVVLGGSPGACRCGKLGRLRGSSPPRACRHAPSNEGGGAAPPGADETLGPMPRVLRGRAEVRVPPATATRTTPAPTAALRDVRNVGVLCRHSSSRPC